MSKQLHGNTNEHCFNPLSEKNSSLVSICVLSSDTDSPCDLFLVFFVYLCRHVKKDTTSRYNATLIKTNQNWGQYCLGSLVQKWSPVLNSTHSEGYSGTPFVWPWSRFDIAVKQILVCSEISNVNSTSNRPTQGHCQVPSAQVQGLSQEQLIRTLITCLLKRHLFSLIQKKKLWGGARAATSSKVSSICWAYLTFSRSRNRTRELRRITSS